ncbi:YhjD/YihY/BrkB family envelope integrity protein [Microbacterium allomyrinae]|uniref:YihY/virulence factor BrkB family protein n=1 Tax=Microbacterium allomyrinae TaxID=2830666 RepID=A0A9X1LSY4_9MICO|nr:YhjD/YihY/BrkB family envelope integrity protein [Microbacterium allomyrinae]MCC2031582.1 YihY/virulence factor BrkB family protein [Microbacterium allomyrinae]
MAGWTMHRLVRAGARSDPGRFMLRLARDLGDLGLIDRGMTLAAHVFTSIIPILIVAGALRASLDARSGPIFAEHLGLDAATAEILEKSLPGGAQELRATGVIGLVVLVIAATSFARALERSIRMIWRTSTVSVKFAWRWLAALIAVVVGLALVVATRIVVHGEGLIPVAEFLAEVVLWGALWWIASWIVINRGVSLRELLPGAVLAGIGFAVAGLFARVLLPPLLADSAARFGVLGMAFTYIGWLLVLSCLLLVASTAGRIVHLTRTGRAWRRSVGARPSA